MSYVLGENFTLLFFILSYFSHIDVALIYGPISLNFASWILLIIALFLVYYSFIVTRYYSIIFIASLILLFFVAILGLGVMP
jgi:hypothetical protein